MAFIERTFCKDPTNWWVPNHAAVVALLRPAGFQITAQPGHEIYLCEIATKPAPCPPDRQEWRSATGNYRGLYHGRFWAGSSETGDGGSLSPPTDKARYGYGRTEPE